MLYFWEGLLRLILARKRKVGQVFYLSLVVIHVEVNSFTIDIIPDRLLWRRVIHVADHI